MILYNEKQLECIKHPIAPLMIIAGAGTGKTTTIIGRIAYFINERNINPENILISRMVDYPLIDVKHVMKFIMKVSFPNYLGGLKEKLRRKLKRRIIIL